jgi:hypothetical protein
MSANVGDRITMHANTVDTPDRKGTIVAVLGSEGPPYRVRFDSWAESIVTPGPDATIEPPSPAERLEQAADRAGEIASEAKDKARAAAGDTTGKAARAVADAATKVAERFRR